MASHWKPYIANTSVLCSAATCYKTHMRYPTNVKLLWECNERVYGEKKRINKLLRGRMPRCQYEEQKDKYLSYQRARRKPHKQTQRRIKSLLYLLEKQLVQLQELESRLGEEAFLPARYYGLKTVIMKVLGQQREWLERGVKPGDLIVSIDKDYIRPIVRGKETKRVEFGAKVNMIQVEGINFIEHISFDAFHEGHRMIASILLGQQLMRTRCTHFSGDRIYATNANRRYCSQNHITTNFIRKGKAGKQEKQRKQMASILNKQRATVTEGSFGTEKNHYGLNKIKARTQRTEMLWILFGVHTANAVRIAKRTAKQEESPPIKKAS